MRSGRVLGSVGKSICCGCGVAYCVFLVVDVWVPGFELAAMCASMHVDDCHIGLRLSGGTGYRR